MTIAILEAGTPPASLIDRFGTYADMFTELLGTEAIATTYDVASGQYPERPEQHEAYLITGSAAGVYDDFAWIEPLKSFLREAKGKTKLIGICFGHQIMAEAFGGRVAKSAKGWGVGLQHYRVEGRQPWMDETVDIAVAVSHQDQVVEQPPRTILTVVNDFCELGGLAYQDQPAISFQFHPEFTVEFAAELIEAIRDRLPDPDAALASLKAPSDRHRVAEWILNFVAAEPAFDSCM